MNLDDIIEYDEENTNLDFKREEYKKDAYTSLIKDIMSMANAINSEVKRIILDRSIINFCFCLEVDVPNPYESAKYDCEQYIFNSYGKIGI